MKVPFLVFVFTCLVSLESVCQEISHQNSQEKKFGEKIEVVQFSKEIPNNSNNSEQFGPELKIIQGNNATKNNNKNEPVSFEFTPAPSSKKPE